MNVKTLVLSIAFVPTLAFAGFKLPGKVFEVTELEKAKSEAQQKGKPIAILYSNKDSTCPLCSNASETILKELGSKTVMVYASKMAELPQNAQEALRPGAYIPKVAVLDAALEKPLGTVTYESIKADPRKAFKEVEAAIRAYKK